MSILINYTISVFSDAPTIVSDVYFRHPHICTSPITFPVCVNTPNLVHMDNKSSQMKGSSQKRLWRRTPADLETCVAPGCKNNSSRLHGSRCMANTPPVALSPGRRSEEMPECELCNQRISVSIGRHRAPGADC